MGSQTPHFLGDFMAEKNAKSSLKYQADKDREKVKGIFKYYEVPGGGVSFVYKKYKGEPIERYDFVDGQVYTVPLGVAKHLNKNGWYPQHEHAVDKDGKPMVRISKKIRRFGFQSLEFVDDADLYEQDSEIVTVESL